MEEKDAQKPQPPTYRPCDTCGKKNHPPERCWQGDGAHLRPERTQTQEKDAICSNSEVKPKRANDSETVTSSQTNSRKADSKK